MINWCFTLFINDKKCFPLQVCEVFLPNQVACNLQPAVSNFAVHRQELLVVHRHEFKLLKFFFLIAFGLYLTFQRKIYTYNMKKSLLACEQITLVILLYLATKFELICPQKTSKSNWFWSTNKMSFSQIHTLFSGWSRPCIQNLLGESWTKI